MKHTSNKTARVHVQNRTPFKGNNLYALNDSGFYIVYSYGTHFPLYAYCHANGVWFENSDGYSRSTARHRSQVRPTTNTHPMSTEALTELFYTAARAEAKVHNAVLKV